MHSNNKAVGLLLLAIVGSLMVSSSQSSPAPLAEDSVTPPVFIPAAATSSTASPTADTGNGKSRAATFATVAMAAEAVSSNVVGVMPSVPELKKMAPVERAAGDNSTSGSAETTTEATTTTTTTTTEAPTTTTASSSLFGGSSGSSSGGTGNAIASLFGGTTAKPADTKDVPKGNFDKHLDGILNNLGKIIRSNGFDPIKIGSLLQCKNCTMEGLSLVRRTGPANLQYANRSLTVDAYLGLPALYISCFPCTDVILMVPFTGMLEVALWDLSIYGKVTQEVKKGASPSLVDYRVDKEGTLDIQLNGYGLLGPVSEIGFKIIHQRRVSDIIREFVYERVPAFIQEKMKGFSLPIGK